jgi:hypothetical protein
MYVEEGLALWLLAQSPSKRAEEAHQQAIKTKDPSTNLVRDYIVAMGFL